jgi:hypothetical protein
MLYNILFAENGRGGRSKTERQSEALIEQGEAEAEGVERSNDDNDRFQRFIFVCS